MAIEQIKKGWLKTRDGFKYAPKTFTQNIIDTEYNKTLDKIISAQTTNINLIEKDLNEISQKVENIGIDGSEDKLYIVDKNDNVIAYFDNTGLHSINYYVGNSTNSEDSLSGIIEKLKNFDGSNSDKLYIIDNNDNVMAYFDASGIHSIDFLIEDQFGQSTKISKLISDINLLIEDVNSIESNLDNQNQRLKLAENELSYIDLPNNENVSNIALLSASLEDDKFFFTDKNDNVIAYVSDTGIHSVEFINKEGINLTNLNQELNTVIGDLNDANNAITNNLNSINLLNEKLKLTENELSYINLPTNENINNTTLLSASSDDDKLYFIDKNDNVIAYIDNTGIHTVEIFNKEGITLTNLQSNINNVISDLNDTNILVNNLQTKAINVEADFNSGTKIGSITMGTLATSQKIDLYTPIPLFTELYTSDSKIKIGTFNYNGVKTELYVPDNSAKINEIISDLADTTLLAQTNQSNINNLDTRLLLTENELSYLDFPMVENTNNISLLSASLNDDKFYFIDKNDNVVAYVDGMGLHSIEFVNKEGLTLSNLQINLNDVISDISETNKLVNNLQTKAMNATANFTSGTKIGSITMGTLAASQSIDLYTPIPSITDNFTNEAKVLVATFNYNGTSTKIYAPDVTGNLNGIAGDLEETNKLVQALQLQAISVTDSVTATNKLQIGNIKIGTLTNSNTVGLYTPVPSITEVYSNEAKVKIGTFNYNGATTTLYAPDDTAKINEVASDLNDTNVLVNNLQTKSISVTANFTSGTKIGNIITGVLNKSEKVELYVPAPSVVNKFTDEAKVEIATFSYNGVSTALYAPDDTAKINGIIGDISDISVLVQNNRTDIGNLDSRLKITENELSYLDFPMVENTNNISLLSASLNDDKLYFIDKNDNTIAYIDDTGVHGTEFINKEGITLTNLQLNIKTLNDDINDFILPYRLPAWTSADEGKVLAIINGKPTWVSQFDNF